MPAPVRPPSGLTPEGRFPRGRDTSIYIGIVKQNDDVQRMGRLGVWIPEFGGDPDDPRFWITVGYASPFAGVTNHKDLVQNSRTMDGSQKSYGFWMIPPDLENQVLVCFINGEMSRGFWFACLYGQNMNHMVPGVAINRSFGQNDRESMPPVVEYNKRDDSVNVNDPLRPAFTPLDEGLRKQGLYTDSERGPASSSARREAPSKVFGFLSPRGNNIHIDDNERNEFIRLRTRGGTQILVHETSGYVYINSKLGNSWLEVSDLGVDIYSNGTISMRSEGDVNIRADKNVLIDAGAGIHLRSGGDTTLASGRYTHINSSSAIRLQSGAGVAIKGQQLVVKANGIGLEASQQIISRAGGANMRFGATVQDNPDSNASISDPGDATVRTPGSQSNTVGQAGSYSTASAQTIVSRMPSHEPWGGHPGRRDGGVSGTGPSSATGPGGVQQSGTGQRETIARNGSSPPVPVGNGTAPDNVRAAICAAAARYNIPASTLFGLAYVESNFQNVPNRSASPTSAKGVFQFIDGTWRSYAATFARENPNERRFTADDVWDVEANSLLGARYAVDSRNTMRQLGINEPNSTDYYMFHLLGPGGGSAFMRARARDPNTPIESVISPATAANNGIRGLTVEQVYQRFGNRIAQGGDFSNACSRPQPENLPTGTTPSTPSDLPSEDIPSS